MYFLFLLSFITRYMQVLIVVVEVLVVLKSMVKVGTYFSFSCTSENRLSHRTRTFLRPAISSNKKKKSVKLGTDRQVFFFLSPFNYYDRDYHIFVIMIINRKSQYIVSSICMICCPNRIHKRPPPFTTFFITISCNVAGDR